MITLTSIAISAAAFLAKNTASHFLGKGLDKLFSKDEFKEELTKVIDELLLDCEKEFKIEKLSGKFPFYHSQIIINQLLKSRLYQEDGDKIRISEALSKNDNIILPSENEIKVFLEMFYDKINANEKLRQLNIESNYKQEIFNITRSIQEIKSSLSNVIDNTALKEEWRRQLDVYKENIKQFKPNTALGLLNRLDDSIQCSDIQPSDKTLSRLNYLRALCYELLDDSNKAQEEFIKCYNKDKVNPLYKEKASYAYYTIGNIEKAKELANEIIQTDSYNQMANFILLVVDNENNLFEKLSQLPDYLRKDVYFKSLILIYIREKNIHSIELQQFLVDTFEINLLRTITSDNFRKSFLYLEYVNYVYFSKNNIIDYNKRLQFNPEIKIIYDVSLLIVNSITKTEMENQYKGVWFLYYFSDYIVKENNDSLLKAKDYLDNNRYRSIYLANGLQYIGNLKEAIEVLSLCKDKMPEVSYFKAFCYGKLPDLIHYNESINEFITLIDKVDVWYFKMLLHFLKSLFVKDSGVEINIKNIIEKSFEKEVHKKIVECLSSILASKDNNIYCEELLALSSSDEIENDEKSILACILFLLLKFELSVKLYRQFLDKNIYNEDLFYYIKALNCTEKDRVELLQLLKEWRLNANHSEELFFDIEYNLRSQLKDWKECLSIMETIYSKYPDKESVFSNYLFCLKKMGENDKIAELKNKLPSIKFSDSNYFYNVVIILFQNGFIQESFELLYPFAKDKENSKIRTLFLSLFINDEAQTVLKKHEIVIEDCYVLIKYEETNLVDIVNIKKGSINDMQKSLLGHKKGDRINIKLPISSVYQVVIIQEIMDKYLALHYDIYQEMKNPIDSNLPMVPFSFPENSSVEDIHDFFVKNFAAEEERRKSSIKDYLLQYKRGEISFSEVSLIFQGDFMKTYYVLNSPEYGILLNPNINYMRQIDLLNKTFVLDFSAIFCFYDLYKEVGISFNHKFIISNSINEFVLNKHEEIKNSPETKMSIDISFTGVKPILFPDDFKRQQLLLYENLKKWIDENCIVEIIEEKLDDLITQSHNDMGESSFVIDYITDYMYIIDKDKDNRILISDDAMLYRKYVNQNVMISSQFYLNEFCNADIINRELLKKNYKGVHINKEFLKTEFIKKISLQDNVYPQCLNNLCYLLPSNKVEVIELISSFLKDIYTDTIVIQDLNRESINLFVCVLDGILKDRDVFVMLHEKINSDFFLLGFKKEEVLKNLIGAIKILLAKNS